jgi:hypothetical protein
VSEVATLIPELANKGMRVMTRLFVNSRKYLDSQERYPSREKVSSIYTQGSNGG